MAGEKRKVGRPIIYCGDPDAPDLTPQERRRIRRRIANRESARRVRARRQDLLEDMAIKVRGALALSQGPATLGGPLSCAPSSARQQRLRVRARARR